MIKTGFKNAVVLLAAGGFIPGVSQRGFRHQCRGRDEYLGCAIRYAGGWCRSGWCGVVAGRAFDEPEVKS